MLQPLFVQGNYRYFHISMPGPEGTPYEGRLIRMNSRFHVLPPGLARRCHVLGRILHVCSKMELARFLTLYERAAFRCHCNVSSVPDYSCKP